MDLTDNEKILIEALRAMDEVPANMLLWYVAGLEESNHKIIESFKDKGWDPEPHIDASKRRIKIAREYQGKIMAKLQEKST